MRLFTRVSMVVLIGLGLLIPFQNCAPMSFEQAGVDSSFLKSDIEQDLLDQTAAEIEEILGEQIEDIAKQEDMKKEDQGAEQEDMKKEDQGEDSDENDQISKKDESPAKVICEQNKENSFERILGHDFYAVRCQGGNGVCAVVCHVNKGNHQMKTLILPLASYYAAFGPSVNGDTNFDGPCHEEDQAVECKTQLSKSNKKANKKANKK